MRAESSYHCNHISLWYLIPHSEKCAECVVKTCFTQLFELSFNGFGTVLTFDVLTFQRIPMSCCLDPLNIVQVELKKPCFRLQNTMDVFFGRKQNLGEGALHSISESGCNNQLILPASKYPNIQISRYHPDILISRCLDLDIPSIIRMFVESGKAADS